MLMAKYMIVIIQKIHLLMEKGKDAFIQEKGL